MLHRQTRIDNSSFKCMSAAYSIEFIINLSLFASSIRYCSHQINLIFVFAQAKLWVWNGTAAAMWTIDEMEMCMCVGKPYSNYVWTHRLICRTSRGWGREMCDGERRRQWLKWNTQKVQLVQISLLDTTQCIRHNHHRISLHPAFRRTSQKIPGRNRCCCWRRKKVQSRERENKNARSKRRTQKKRSSRKTSGWPKLDSLCADDDDF